MDYSRYQSGNVVHVITGDQAVYATEDEYRAWDSGDSCFGDGPTNYSYQERQSQSRSGSEPPNKKTKGSQDSAATSRSRAIGKMFFKTKLCCKFRNGTCPYVTNCNFAHSVEELRRPPPNWQEIVAAHEEERAASSEPREEFQIPAVVGCSGESQRSYKGRHCKKFYTEEGCPYGDSCTFVHDEQSKNRESVAISLGPGGYSGSGGGSGGVTTSGGNGGGGNMQNIKPSNWKTRICNKWEITGYCPFGNKCHFAHGAAELHRYGGGLMEGEAKDGNSTPADSKQGTSTPKMPADSVTASTAVPHPDVYHLGVPSQRSSIVLQRPGIRAHQKWKGPNKISKIYGDWIDDLE